MIEYRKPLEEYRDLTLTLIEEAKNGEELIELINRRDETLKGFDESDYKDEEFKRIAKELNIVNLNNELELIVKKEMVKIKKQIEYINKSRVTRDVYRHAQPTVKFFTKRA